MRLLDFLALAGGFIPRRCRSLWLSSRAPSNGTRGASRLRERVRNLAYQGRKERSQLFPAEFTSAFGCAGKLDVVEFKVEIKTAGQGVNQRSR